MIEIKANQQEAGADCLNSIPHSEPLPSDGLLLEERAVPSEKAHSQENDEGTVTALSQLTLSIYLPSFLNVVATSLMIPVVPLFAQYDLGASTTTVGVVIAAQGAGKMIANLPSGKFTVAFGDRLAVSAGFAIQAVAGGLMAIAPNVAFLVAAELLMGVSGSLLQVGRQSYMKEAVATALRGRSLAFIGGTARVGSIVGPFLGGWVYASGSARAALALQVLFAAAGLLLTLAFMVPRQPVVGRFVELAPVEVVVKHHEHHRAPVGEGDEETAPDEAAEAEVGLVSPPPSLSQETSVSKEMGAPVTLKTVWLENWRKLCSVALYGGILFIPRVARDLLIPLVSDACGASEYQVGKISSVSYVVDSMLFYSAGALMDRYGRKFNGVASPLVLLLGFLQLSTSLPRSRPAVAGTAAPELTALLLNASLFGNETSDLFSEGGGGQPPHEDGGHPAGGTLGGKTLMALYGAASILGLGNGLSAGLVMTFGTDIAPMNPEARGLFLGLFRMFTDSGITVGSLLIGAIAEALSLRSACFVASASALVAASQLLLCVEETLRR